MLLGVPLAEGVWSRFSWSWAGAQPGCGVHASFSSSAGRSAVPLASRQCRDHRSPLGGSPRGSCSAPPGRCGREGCLLLTKSLEEN